MAKKARKKESDFTRFMRKNKYLLIGLGVFVLIAALMVGLNSDSDENRVYGDDRIDMYYFHLSTCPHCHKQNEFNEFLKEKYPQLNIIEFELTSRESQEKYVEMASQFPGLQGQAPATPTTMIGDQYNVGYGSDETTGQKIIAMIEARKAEIDASWNPETMIRSDQLQAEQ
jgi:glutaredoxin